MLIASCPCRRIQNCMQIKTRKERAKTSYSCRTLFIVAVTPGGSGFFRVFLLEGTFVTAFLVPPLTSYLGLFLRLRLRLLLPWPIRASVRWGKSWGWGWSEQAWILSPGTDSFVVLPPFQCGVHALASPTAPCQGRALCFFRSVF